MQEISSTAQWVVESGLSAALLALLVWIVKTAFKSIERIIESKDDQLATANQKYYELSEKMLIMTERFHAEETEQKDMLIRILTRMEEKLDQPVRCPAQVNDRIGG
jgi:glycerate-2-kinase